MHCIEIKKVRAILEAIRLRESNASSQSLAETMYGMNGKLKCPLTISLYTKEFDELLSSKRTENLLDLLYMAADNLKNEVVTTTNQADPKHEVVVEVFTIIKNICYPTVTGNASYIEDSIVSVAFNAMLRLRESIVRSGYVYTAIHGKVANQLVTLQACGLILDEEAGQIQPSVRTYKLNKYMYKILSDIFFSNGELSNARHLSFSHSELLNAEMLQVITNKLCQYIEGALAPLTYVVLKGAQCVAAYSNKCSHTTSCMQHASVSTFLPYVINPETVRVLVGVDKHGFIKSRRIIYKIKGQEDAWYAGRVYASERVYYEAFEDFLSFKIDKPTSLTIHTMGGDSFKKLIEEEYKLSDNSLRNDAVSQNNLLDKLHDIYSHSSAGAKPITEEVYNFVDSTANSRGPHGISQRYSITDTPQDYRTDFYYPVMYKGQPLARCHPYADDLMGFAPGNEMIVDRHPDMPELLTIKVEALVGFDDRPAVISLDNYRNQTIYNTKKDIDELRLQELTFTYDSFGNLFGSDVVPLDFLKREPQFPMQFYATLSITNRSTAMLCRPVRSESNRFPNHPELAISDTLMPVSQWVWLPKEWLTYRINEEGKGCVGLVPPSVSRNKALLTDLKIAALGGMSAKGIQLFKIDEDGTIKSELIDIAKLLPDYLELAQKHNISNLMIEERTDYGVNVNIYSGARAGFNLFVPEDMTVNILTYHRQQDSAGKKTYTISREKYLDIQHESMDIVKLEPTIYGDDKRAFAEQVVSSLCGTILRPHARRLKDGSIVHKEVYDAFRKVESFTELQHSLSTHTLGVQ